MKCFPAITIAALRPAHWPELARIYADAIATGNATFETEVPAWETWDRSHSPAHRFVALDDGRVVGWAAVSQVSDRCVYAGVVENSVYVSEDARRRGVGRLLLQRLTDSTEAAGIWTIQTGIFPENLASVHLHRSVGFEVVGRRRKLGKLAGVWRDVLLLERRSEMVGNASEVLFVCVANSGRSVMAERIFARRADGRHRARSAGSDPGTNVHPVVVAALREIGIDARDHVPRKLDPIEAAAMDVVVSTCGDEACPVTPPGTRRISWNLPDPQHLALEDVRPIRDEIERRVGELIRQLDGVST